MLATIMLTLIIFASVTLVVLKREKVVKVKHE